MSRPLEGLVVLDLTWVLAGPYCAMVLRDLGADVIKIERPPAGDIARTTGPYQNDWSGYFFSINRGKRSVAIDLKQPEGRDAFLRLVEQADVVLENYTPGTMDRLGLGYEALRERNERIILGSISGFGQTGPYRDRPALDVIVQGMGGVMSITGEPGGGPVRPGTSYGDITAGLYAAIAVLAAVHERERSGEGQAIDISMLDCQVSVLENAIVRYGITGEVPGPIGTRHPSATPFQAFPTADGFIVVALAFGSENQWQMLCALLGVPEIIDDPRFASSPLRTMHHAELEPILNGGFRTRPTAEWMDELVAAGIPCGPVNNVADVFSDPQIQQRGMLQPVTHPDAGTVTIANTPIRMSRSETGIAGPPPNLGQDTEQVLTDLGGLSPEAYQALLDAGVVANKGGPDIAAILGRKRD